MVAAIPPACCLDEAELRSLVDDDCKDVDQGLEEDLRVVRSMAAELQGDEDIPSESWDWAEAMEPVLRGAAVTMAEQEQSIRRGGAALSRTPGEEAFVEALRRQAAFAGARRADAEELAAALRRVQERELRRVAARGRVTDPAMPGLLEQVARETDASVARGEVPGPEELRMAGVGEGVAAAMQRMMAALAGRLRRGAAVFAASPGEETLVDALQRQADNADAASATLEAFAASVRRFRAADSRGPDPAGAGEGALLPRLSSVWTMLLSLSF
ncbi:hypothetical protein ACP4OV_002986 [Aristida adscensionis]